MKHILRDRHDNRLPSWQRRALAHLLEHRSIPFSRSVYGRRHSDPAAFIAVVTAKALAANGLATISRERLRLTPRGLWYARALAAGEGRAA
jgi:hypothetical protein